MVRCELGANNYSIFGQIVLNCEFLQLSHVNRRRQEPQFQISSSSAKYSIDKVCLKQTALIFQANVHKCTSAKN